MKRIFYSFIALMLMLCASVSANAVTITKTIGWFEAGAVEWTWESGATYTVYYRPKDGSYTKLDQELVRQYSTYGRADMVGLKAGTYQFKVVSSTSGEAESELFTAVANDRNGFAHYNRSTGIGAYNNDGTLKTNARVLYVTAANAKTVKCNVTDGKNDTEYTGIQAIINAYQKGKETRPLDVRIIGTVKKADLDAIGSSAEGLQVKGKSGDIDMNITIEGIGNDAAVHGFGFLLHSAGSVELRNFAIMICMDDCVSIDTDNKHCWVHNMDFFYGGTGGDADQAKGDGTVDIKAKSSFITVSYNHFFDSGKCSLGGMKSETIDCWMTYHHNWFDHSDSRHPRIRTAFYHVYNNYFDGNAKYGIGVTMGGSSFVEANYFRNCKYPMLSSKQGTDAQGDGTFSGENGGVIKAYNNKIINPKQVLYWASDKVEAGEWDAVQASSRDENITATAYTGGTSYNNDATTEAIKAVPTVDDPADVAAIVRGDKDGRLGAGRMEGGDFKWTFKYTAQDTNYDVIADLKSTLVNYASTLVAYGDGTAAGNAGGSAVDGGDGKGVTQSYGEDTPKPDYGGTSGGDTPEVDDMQPYLTSISSSTATDGDFYWFTADNDVTTTTKVMDKVIALTAGESASSYTATPDESDQNKYGVQLGKNGGYGVFYCSTGIPYISAKCYRTGTLTATAYQSEDGTTWTEIGKFSAKKGLYTISFASTGKESGDVTTYPKYIKLSNGSTGGLYIEGIKIYTVKDGEAAITHVELTDDNNADATVTLDGTALTSQSYTKNIEYDDATASYTIVVTPKISGATVTATSLATPVEGKTNTWTVAAPAKTSQSKVNVKFTVTSKDGSTTKVYSVSIVRGSAPVGDAIYDFTENIGTTDGTTGGPKSYTANKSFKFDTSSQYIIVTPVSGEKFKSGDQIEIIGQTGKDGKNMGLYFATSADGRTSGSPVYIAAAKSGTSYTTTGTLTLTKETDKLYVFRYDATSTTVTSLKIYHTNPSYPTASLNSAGFATYSSSVDVAVKTSGVTAYKAVVSGSKITLTALDGYIPESTGVILYGENLTNTTTVEFEAPASTATKASNLSGNSLQPTTTANVALVNKSNVSGTIWALGNGYEFLKYSNTVFTANRAYLVYEKSSAKEMTIVFADDATGINAVNTDNNNDTDACYNLAGQRISANAKGIVIRNGRKYINK